MNGYEAVAASGGRRQSFDRTRAAEDELAWDSRAYCTRVRVPDAAAGAMLAPSLVFDMSVPKKKYEDILGEAECGLVMYR